MDADAAEGKPARRQVRDILETDEARTLLAHGQENGSLTSDEIALAFDELELDPGQLDEFYNALEEAQIEMVDETAADAPEDGAARALPRRGRSRPTPCSSSSRTSARSTC